MVAHVLNNAISVSVFRTIIETLASSSVPIRNRVAVATMPSSTISHQKNMVVAIYKCAEGVCPKIENSKHKFASSVRIRENVNITTYRWLEEPQVG